MNKGVNKIWNRKYKIHWSDRDRSQTGEREQVRGQKIEILCENNDFKEFMV